MTTTKADEIKAEIATLIEVIGDAKLRRAAVLRRVELWNDYITQKETRLLTLQAQLEREDTVLMKPTGPCVTLTAHDGVKWDV